MASVRQTNRVAKWWSSQFDADNNAELVRHLNRQPKHNDASVLWSECVIRWDEQGKAWLLEPPGS